MSRHQTPEERDAALRIHSVSRFTHSEFDQADPAIQHAPLFIEGLTSASTTATYATGLIRWLRWCAARGVRAFDVKKPQAKIFLAGLSHLAPRTRAAIITSIRSFYDSAMDEDLIDRSPFDRVYPKHAVPIENSPAMTQAQFEDVLTVIARQVKSHPNSLSHRRDYALVYLTGRIGPRRVSLAHLQVRDLTLEGGVTFIRFRLKGDRYDRVALPPDVAAVIWSWLKELACAAARELGPLDFIFPATAPNRSELSVHAATGRIVSLTTHGISYQVRRRLADAGITGARWSAHALRSTAATIAHENGANVEEIQRMLSHLNRAQTEAYIRRRDPESAARYWVPQFGNREDKQDAEVAP